MINVDVGFVLQVASLLVFIPLMDRLVFRKVRSVTEEREARIGEAQGRAAAAASRASELESERRERINAARQEGVARGQMSMDQARSSVEGSLAEEASGVEARLHEARARMTDEISSARPELARSVDQLADMLARHLVAGGAE